MSGAEPTPPPAGSRSPSAIDRLAERWLATSDALRPEQALVFGRPGNEARYSDLSPAGLETVATAQRAVLLDLDREAPADEVDAVTAAELRRELRLDLDHLEAGRPFADVNNIASPVQSIREAFDLEADGTREDWERIALRLRNVPAAVAGYVEGLRHGVGIGVVPAIRQVRLAAEEAAETGDADGFFADLARRGAGCDDVPPALARELEQAGAAAAAAYGRLAAMLRDELAPAARAEDAVGRDVYALESRRFLGAAVDLDETYAWGLEELRRITREQEAAAARIAAGSVDDAIAALDAEPGRGLDGVDALRGWMQDLSDATIERLAGAAFDIPDRLRRLECRIAPTHSGAIYYAPPSSDFSRPGTMWWSVPEGVERFTTWRETTIVHHEGVPGHHLQIATPMAQGTLNAWRRAAGTSGHAEGWALYAERLMAELGFLDDPGDLLGMLDSQRLRAARVVIDIGLHLGLRDPDGRVWTRDSGLELLRRNSHIDDAVLRFEIDRYCGFPGQAASYTVGERIWEEVRADAAARPGFDLRAFHAEALALGGLGLDTLRSALAPARP